MKHRPAHLLLLALPFPVSASDFDARVAAARAAIATPAGHVYDMALVPAVHAATTRCVPSGKRVARAADSFTAVARVAADGRVTDVQVRPVTPLSACFARTLGAIRLQPLPVALRRPAGHPIVIGIRDRF